MVRPQEEMNYFAVMGLTPTATEADIRKAYRKLSLALHPDKNLDMDPEVASAKFHEMQLAYEILMDPAARLAATERTKADDARKERRGAYEGKRKEMAEELERREEEDRMKRFKGAQDEQRQRAILEKLREEGKKLREEKERKIMEAEEQARQKLEKQSQKETKVSQLPPQPPLSIGQPELGPLDLTVKLRFPADQFVALTRGASASPSMNSNDALQTPLARGLESRFGKLDSLIWKTPKSEKKKSREATAHATFKTLDSAYAAVKAGSQLRAGEAGLAEVLEDVWIGWAAGSRSTNSLQEVMRSGEPARITWMREQGLLSSGPFNEEGTVQSGNSKPNQTSEEDVLKKMKSQMDGRAQTEDGKKRNNSFPSFSFTASTNNLGKPSSSNLSSDNPIPVDFESSTLQQMREAERRRMEEAIRQVDEQSMYT